MDRPTKSSSGKASVTNERVGKTHTPNTKMSGQGKGANKRDSATNTSTYGGGKTLRYTSGDVTRTSTSNNKYK